MSLYQEEPEAGNTHRARWLAQIDALIANRYREATDRRDAGFCPDTSSVAAWEESLTAYRRRCMELLGWPHIGGPEHRPSMRTERLGDDDEADIFRVWIETLPGLETYGLLFVPHGQGPFPLVISQHGGGGTPELCSSFFDSSNYNDMSRRILRRGCIVFAPQLPMWDECFGAGLDRVLLDRKLQHLGGTGVGLDVWQLQRSLDLLLARPDVDVQRVGMLGLSWGGYYTLVTTALETRIRAAIASGFLLPADQLAPMAPAIWFDAANHFHMAELGALVCPRHLYVEVGRSDPHQVVVNASDEAARLVRWYERVGLADRCRFVIHDGAHEFNRADDGLDFLVNALAG